MKLLGWTWEQWAIAAARYGAPLAGVEIKQDHDFALALQLSMNPSLR